MKVFVLDDETRARKTTIAYVKRMLGSGCEIREAGDIDAAIDVLATYRPDIAFLDVMLGEGTSFDFLGTLDHIHFKIIFITAHDSFAIKAFKFSAVDYLLKPINPLEFKAAIEKAVASTAPQKEQLQGLAAMIDDKRLQKIILKDHQAMHFVEVDTIIYCRSDNSYTTFTTTTDQIVISRSIGEYEDMLSQSDFFRSHRTCLVNLHHIKKVEKKEGGMIEMSNGDIVPLARNRKEALLRIQK